MGTGSRQQREAVFLALSDGTRRRVLEVLVADGGATATQLASAFPVSRQAIAKHLAVLADAGLAASERRGRETQWMVTPEALGPAMAWMAALAEAAGGDGAAGDEFGDRVADLQRHLGERSAERGIGVRPRSRPGSPASSPVPTPGRPLRIAASGRPPRPEPPRRFP